VVFCRGPADAPLRSDRLAALDASPPRPVRADAAASAASIASSSTLGGCAPDTADRPSKMKSGTPAMPW
jgi:hypothetical protein